MDFENLPLARDLLYLSAGLAGIVLGCVLSLSGRTLSTRRRNRIITLSLCTASVAVLSLAGMLICSGGNILFAGPFLIPSGIGIVILALAFLFPRAVAFPLFLACGLLVVFLGYTFLRFPLLASGGTPLALVHQQPDKTLLIRFTYHLGYGDETGDLVIEDGGEAPEFSATRIYFDERYPLIGGQNRGALTRVRRTTEDYYAHTFPVAEQNPLGISFQTCHTGPGPLPPGKAVLFLVDGKTPSLRWSGRL